MHLVTPELTKKEGFIQYAIWKIKEYDRSIRPIEIEKTAETLGIKPEELIKPIYNKIITNKLGKKAPRLLMYLENEIATSDSPILREEKQSILKRRASKRYYKTENGKGVQKRYHLSKKGIATRSRYERSQKGQSSREKYARSDAKQSTQKKYNSSEMGRLKRKEYEESEKGKIARQKTNDLRIGKAFAAYTDIYTICLNKGFTPKEAADMAALTIKRGNTSDLPNSGRQIAIKNAHKFKGMPEPEAQIKVKMPEVIRKRRVI